MSLEDDYTQRAQRLQDEYGYVVMSWSPGPKPPPKVGDVIPAGGVLFGRGMNPVPVALLCIGEATLEDWKRQREALNASLEPSPPAEDLFFKVIAE